MSDPGERGGSDSARSSRRLSTPPALGCLGSIALGLLGVALFFAVLSLTTRGEIRIPRGELGEIRIWMIREGENQGLGRSSTRVIQGSERSGKACLQTKVGFLMMRSEEPPESLTYCECLIKEGDVWQSAGDCPNESK